jgi:hypothetical protein
VPSRRIAVLGAAAVLALTGAVVLAVGLGAGQGSAALRDVGPSAATPTAVPGPVAGPTPTPTPVARWTPSSPVHLSIPAVHLDLPLLALEPKEDVIDPPLLTAGYWIEPYGKPVGAAGDAENTLYIAAHSLGRGKDGFDPLLTPDHTASALVPGDVVEVSTPDGTVDYTVQSSRRYGKDELPSADEVWAAVPGRLVLITCFQRSDGRASTENLVVIADSE